MFVNVSLHLLTTYKHIRRNQTDNIWSSDVWASVIYYEYSDLLTYA